MAINTSGNGGPNSAGAPTPQVEQSQNSQGTSRALNASFSESVEGASRPELKDTKAVRAAEAFESAVHEVAAELRDAGKLADESAIELVIERAIEAQFGASKSDEELAELVEEAQFLLADDPFFAPSTIRELNEAIAEQG